MIRLQRKAGTFLPTVEQHHLLRACLLNDRESFAKWQSLVDLDAIDRGSMRLLPLLYRHHPAVPRLKGVYRQVWFRNQLILDHGARAMRALEGAGIPAVALKGAALATTVYDEPAQRPMEDYDGLVPHDRFARAVEVMLASGWSFHPPLADPESHFVFQHAIGFRRDGGGELDLHWTADGLPPDAALRPLAPVDLLLQTCAHATLLNPHVPPIRWAADAFLLIARDAIVWEDVVALARERRLSLTMHRCLEYLRDGLGVAIPDLVLDALARDVTFRERASLALRNAPGRFAYLQFVVEWLGHAGASRRLLMLPRFLRSYCRVDSNAALLRLATSRLVLNTRRA
jgi:Uncharacterised nucleotidyltransferase